MKTIFLWLNRPYPFSGTWSKNLSSAGWGGMFVMLFLLVFRPFGVQAPESSFWLYLITCFYFGLVTFGVLFVAALVIRAMPGFFRENDWTVWKEVMSNLVFISLIGFSNLIFAHFYFGQKITGSVIWFWQKATFMVGIFPVLFTAYTKQHFLQKRYSTGADSLNAKIESHPKAYEAPSAETLAITLVGDNQNESLTLPLDQIFYAEAADNYVRVFYQNDTSLQSGLLRSTLKNIESQLQGHSQFFRCHRTFLVNLDQVVHVSGNAQGYKLHLEGCERTIPVSRSLNEEISQRIK